MNELARPFTISQQAISKHLAYLERARLIEKQRMGRERLCALKPGAMTRVTQWAQTYGRLWEQSFQRLDALLAGIEEKESRRGRKK